MALSSVSVHAQGDRGRQSLAGSLEVGMHVWVPCATEVWRDGVVVGIGEESDNRVKVEILTGANDLRETVVLAASSQEGPPPLLRKNKDVSTVDGAKAAQDLGKLSLLHEAAVLHVLQVRYEQSIVYTRAGPMLLALNPFRNIPELYSRDRLRSYANLHASDTAESSPAEPHVYGVARAAYRGIWHEGVPQTVLVSGESGAGKTETTKFVMQYLSLSGISEAGDPMSAVERNVLHSIPLLEAFGNAKTPRNDNSSRFGKYIELQFGRADSGGGGPRLVGAQTHTYLLEKVRAIGVQKGERSFHIFYQVLAAAAGMKGQTAPSTDASCIGAGGTPEPLVAPDPALASLITIVGSASMAHQPRDFACLAKSSCEALGDHDEASDFQEVLAAMRAFGISEEDIADTLAVILTVLYLGNFCFRQSAEKEGSEVIGRSEAGSPIAIASCLLGVDAGDLEETLCSRVMKVPGELNTIKKSRTVAQAEDGRDALARHLYGSIFAFIVGRINTVLGIHGGDKKASSSHRGLCPFVGLLDIFGFEVFQHNSFEQLCINFANELLQQYLNEIIFEHEAALYARECVPLNVQDFPDNRHIVELFAGARSQPLSGIFAMLDEECRITGGTPDSLCRKFEVRHKTSKIFELVRTRKGHFVIRHFAGLVEYDSKEFLAKNKDKLTADVQELMSGSSKAFVRQRFLEHDRTFGAQNSSTSSRVMRAKDYSVSSDFRQQLQALMQSIRTTSPHFVRCIKPNPQSVERVFHRQSVVEQLRFQGVLQATLQSRSAHPLRLRHREAILDFWKVTPSECQSRLEVQMRLGAFADAACTLVEGLQESVARLLPNDIQIGTTMIFFKQEAVEVLGLAVGTVRERAALQAQTFWRRVRCMRWYTGVRRAVLRLQAGARMWAARRLATHLRRERAAVRLQSAERGRCARARCRVRLQCVLTLQACLWELHYRRLFLRIMQATPVIQKCLRGALARSERRRLLRAAVHLQAAWRQILALRKLKELREEQIRLKINMNRLVYRWSCRKLRCVRERIEMEMDPQRTSLESQGCVDELPALWERPGELAAAAAALQRCNLALAYDEAVLGKACATLRGRAAEHQGGCWQWVRPRRRAAIHDTR